MSQLVTDAKCYCIYNNEKKKKSATVAKNNAI